MKNNLLLFVFGISFWIGSGLVFGAEGAAKLCSNTLLHASLVEPSKPIGEELAKAIALDLVLDGAQRGDSVTNIIDQVNTYGNLVHLWKNRDLVLSHFQSQELISLADFQTRFFKSSKYSSENVSTLRKALPMTFLLAYEAFVQEDRNSELRPFYKSHIEPEFLTRLVLFSIQRLDFPVTSDVFKPLESHLAQLSDGERAQLLPKIQEYRYIIASARDAGDHTLAKEKSRELLDLLNP